MKEGTKQWTRSQPHPFFTGLAVAVLAGLSIPTLLLWADPVYVVAIPVFVAAAAMGFHRFGFRFVIPYLLLFDIVGWCAGIRDYPNAQRVHALLVGGQVLVAVALSFIPRWASGRKTLGAFCLVDATTLGFFVLGNLVALCVGLVNHNDKIYLVGDTYNLLLIPAGYLLVNDTIQASDAQFLLGSVAWCHFVGSFFIVGERLASAIEGNINRYGGPNMLPFVYFLVRYSNERNPARRRLYFLLFLVSALIVAITASRRCWISALAAFALLALIENKWKLLQATSGILAGVAVLALAVFLIPVTQAPAVSIVTDSIEKIEETYMDGHLGTSGQDKLWEIDTVLDGTVRSGDPVRVLFGNGSGAQYVPWWGAWWGPAHPGHTLYGDTDYRFHHVHNTYAAVLFRMGTLGVVLLAIFLVSALYETLRLFLARRALPEDQRLAVETLLVFLVITVLLEMNSIYSFLGQLYWGVLLGLLGVLMKQERPLTEVRRRLLAC